MEATDVMLYNVCKIHTNVVSVLFMHICVYKCVHTSAL